MDLKGRNFLTLKDFTKEEIEYLIDLSAMLKEKKKKGEAVDVLKGKNIALIFEKNSTRTRCSFEVAASDLGMGSTFLDPKSSQIGKKESIKDTARVLGRIYDGIEYRGFGQEIVEELAKYAGVPVWNGLTNEYHPTQMLADLMTIKEHLGKVEGLKLVYLGDARYNMGNSLMILCAKMGMHFVACAPKKYFPDPELVEQCKGYAKESGATITLTEDVKEGTKGADVVCTDVWYPWASLTKYGKKGSANCLHIRLPKKLWRMQEARLSSFTVCHLSMTWIQRSERKWERSTELQRWKLQMKSLSLLSLWYLTRLKTVCTLSKQLWQLLWEQNFNEQRKKRAVFPCRAVSGMFKD